MENLVNIKINGFDYQVPAGSTILEAAHSAGIEIPTLCYLKDINAIGACRICVVEVKGARSLVASCVFPVNEGMEIFTNTPKVIESRKTTLELILSTHKKECLSCVRSGNCELQQLCKDYGIVCRKAKKYPIDFSHNFPLHTFYLSMLFTTSSFAILFICDFAYTLRNKASMLSYFQAFSQTILLLFLRSSTYLDCS